MERIPSSQQVNEDAEAIALLLASVEHTGGELFGPSSSYKPATALPPTKPSPSVPVGKFVPPPGARSTYWTPPVKPNPLQCQTCGMKFSKACNLSRHWTAKRCKADKRTRHLDASGNLLPPTKLPAEQEAAMSRARMKPAVSPPRPSAPAATGFKASIAGFFAKISQSVTGMVAPSNSGASPVSPAPSVPPVSVPAVRQVSRRKGAGGQGNVSAEAAAVAQKWPSTLQEQWDTFDEETLRKIVATAAGHRGLVNSLATITDEWPVNTVWVLFVLIALLLLLLLFFCFCFFIDAFDLAGSGCIRCWELAASPTPAWTRVCHSFLSGSLWLPNNRIEFKSHGSC